MILGLTGKLCSGKNLAADRFAERGWTVIDEDLIGHRALVENAAAVIEAFGPGVTDDDGAISRRKLGEIVFRLPENLRRLEAIVHPWMVAETRRLLEMRSTEHGVVNAAILFKMGLHELCDRVLVVRAFPWQRFRRCLSRDTLGAKQIIVRMLRQRSLNSAPKGVDTVTVWNIGSKRRFLQRIDALFP